jgi:hypothetical protein
VHCMAAEGPISCFASHGPPRRVSELILPTDNYYYEPATLCMAPLLVVRLVSLSGVALLLGFAGRVWQAERGEAKEKKRTHRPDRGHRCRFQFSCRTQQVFPSVLAHCSRTQARITAYAYPYPICWPPLLNPGGCKVPSAGRLVNARLALSCDGPPCPACPAYLCAIPISPCLDHMPGSTACALS